jgi:hypothetical protein
LASTNTGTAGVVSPVPALPAAKGRFCPDWLTALKGRAIRIV